MASIPNAATVDAVPRDGDLWERQLQRCGLHRPPSAIDVAGAHTAVTTASKKKKVFRRRKKKAEKTAIVLSRSSSKGHCEHHDGKALAGTGLRVPKTGGRSRAYSAGVHSVHSSSHPSGGNQKTNPKKMNNITSVSNNNPQCQMRRTSYEKPAQTLAARAFTFNHLGVADREAAEAQLHAGGLQSGDYVIRICPTIGKYGNSWGLAVYCDTVIATDASPAALASICHYKVTKRRSRSLSTPGNDQFKFGIQKGYRFESVSTLLKHYHEEPDGLCCALRRNVSRISADLIHADVVSSRRSSKRVGQGMEDAVAVGGAAAVAAAAGARRESSSGSPVGFPVDDPATWWASPSTAPKEKRFALCTLLVGEALKRPHAAVNLHYCGTGLLAVGNEEDDGGWGGGEGGGSRMGGGGGGDGGCVKKVSWCGWTDRAAVATVKRGAGGNGQLPPLPFRLWLVILSFVFDV